MLKDLRRHIMMQPQGGGPVLPPEYQQVEWLQSDGNSWIIFPGGFELGNAKISITLIYPSNTDGYEAIFGSTSTLYYRIIKNSSSIFNLYITKSVIEVPGGSYASGVVFRVEFDNNNPIFSFKAYKNGILTWSNQVTTTINETIQQNYYLFRQSNISYRGHQKLIDFELESGSVHYHFIPCYRKADNVAGIYDVENGVFYTNAGTGTFIVGPDV